MNKKLTYFSSRLLPDLSRIGTVTSFAVAVLPRDAISFSFSESCGRKILSGDRASNLASSTDNLQKFPLLRRGRVIYAEFARSNGKSAALSNWRLSIWIMI